MKKLLGILGALTVVAAPITAVSWTQIKSSNYNIVEQEAIDSYNKMTEILNKPENFKNEDFINTYSDVINVIHKIYSKQSLDEYMNMVYIFKNAIDKLDLTLEQKDYVQLIQNNIADTLKDWNNDIDLKKLIGEYDKYLGNEKYAVKKMYYAYNQLKSDQMIKDMEIYQPWRMKQVEAQAELASLKQESDLLNQHVAEFDRMKVWQKKVGDIFDRWIAKANNLRDGFMTIWDSYFGSPEKFAQKMFDKAHEIVDKTVQNYIDDFKKFGLPEEVAKLKEKDIEEMYKKMKKEIQKSKGETIDGVPDFIQNIPTHDGDPSGPNAQSPTNEDVQKAAQKEIDKEDKEKVDTVKKLKKKLQTASKVLKKIYSVDTLLFGEIHDQAQDFLDFAKKEVPQLSDDVAAAYKANGISYESAIDSQIKNAVAVASAVVQEALDIFNPMKGKINDILDFAFSTVDEIAKWAKDLNVLYKSDEVISVIQEAKENATKIPEDNIIDINDTLQKLEQNKVDTKNFTLQLNEANEKLKNSHFSDYQIELDKWTKFFEKYYDFIGIEIESRSVVLNPKKYFEIQLSIYKDVVLKRQEIYLKIINNKNSELYPEEIDNIKKQNKQLEDINLFISQIEGEVI